MRIKKTLTAYCLSDRSVRTLSHSYSPAIKVPLLALRSGRAYGMAGLAACMLRLIPTLAALILCVLQPSFAAAALAAGADDTASVQTPPEGRAPALIIFAASSLAPPLNALAEAYAAAYSVPLPRISYGPSATLARQISLGAPADIFISANPTWAESAAKATGATPQTLVDNTLVLAVPARSPHNALVWSRESLEAYFKTNRLVIADPKTAPAGAYALAALEHLLGARPAPSQLFYASSAAQAALSVEKSGNAGLIYASSLIGRPQLSVAAAPPANSYPAIRYAYLQTRPHTTAPDFYSYITSLDAAPVWQAHGFIVSN